jgi:hypothetical protein
LQVLVQLRIAVKENNQLKGQKVFLPVSKTRRHWVKQATGGLAALSSAGLSRGIASRRLRSCCHGRITKHSCANLAK